MRSFSPKLFARAAFAACVYLSAGCGGSSSNLYDAPSGGSGTASGGSAAPNGSSGAPSTSGGASPAAGMNSVGISGSTSAGSGGMNNPGNPNNAPCSAAKDVTGGASGVLGTTGPACLRVTGDIAGWGCSNFDGRTLKVNGRSVMCAELPLPDKIDGAYYF